MGSDTVINGIALGVAVVIFIALLAVVIALFSTSKDTSNSGVVQLQDSLGTFNLIQFEDYNQKVVAGSQVKSALSTYTGTPYAIIIKTCKGEWVNYNALVTPFTSKSGGEKSTAAPFKGITLDALTKQYTVSESYFNELKTSVNGTNTIALQLSDGGGDVDKQTVLYNTVTTGLSKQGNVNYVASTSKFSAYLIYDAGDEIIGMVFIQQGKHTKGS